MNLFGEVVRTFRWNVGLRYHGLTMRLRGLMTLLVVMGSIGTAIGYAVATRNVRFEDEPDDADPTG